MKRRRDLILGPPGTGKTTRLLREIENLRSAGYDLGDIGFVSFTKRAVREAIERGAAVFGVSADDVPWFRTLHSSFTRAMGLRGSAWLEEDDYDEFCQRYGYRLTKEGVDDDTDAAKNDDKLKAADDYARLRLCSLDAAARRTGADMRHLPSFVERHRAFRRQSGKMDFTDILEEAVRRGTRLPVRVLIVDEAQDLCPLQIEALGPTIAAAEVVIVAGDDDQAIFAYQGAAPEWIIGLTRDAAWRTEVLSQSWRVPARVHALAQRIIERCPDRVPKVYRPRDAEGLVMRDVTAITSVLIESEGSAAFLARTQLGTRSPARTLFNAREVPYRIERGAGPNPLGRPTSVRAVQTAWALAKGEPIARTDLMAMLEFVPSRHDLKLLDHGAKAALERLQASSVMPDDIDALGLGRLRQHAQRQGPCQILLKMQDHYRDWFAAMWARHGKIPEPRIVLSTIHGAKGAEWDTVIVSPDHPQVVETALHHPDTRDAEHRVAYVAATRARQRLLIARREGPHGYRYG
jgi:superfamily I DNA/RNA helicase